MADADHLPPLAPGEVRAWKAALAGEQTAGAIVARWRWLSDAVYHARVYMWERRQEQDDG